MEAKDKIEKFVKLTDDVPPQAVKKLEEEDNQILIRLAEASGSLSDLWLAYNITWKDRNGQKQERTVLSSAGIFEAAILRGGLELKEGPVFEKEDSRLRCRIVLRDKVSGNDVLGFDAMTIPKDNSFAREKLETILATKALRNAYKKVIPVEIKAKVLDKAGKYGLIKNLQLFQIRGQP